MFFLGGIKKKTLKNNIELLHFYWKKDNEFLHFLNIVQD